MGRWSFTRNDRIISKVPLMIPNGFALIVGVDGTYNDDERLCKVTLFGAPIESHEVLKIWIVYSQWYIQVFWNRPSRQRVRSWLEAYQSSELKKSGLTNRRTRPDAGSVTRLIARFLLLERWSSKWRELFHKRSPSRGSWTKCIGETNRGNCQRMTGLHQFRLGNEPNFKK